MLENLARSFNGYFHAFDLTTIRKYLSLASNFSKNQCTNAKHANSFLVENNNSNAFDLFFSEKQCKEKKSDRHAIVNTLEKLNSNNVEFYFFSFLRLS